MVFRSVLHKLCTSSVLILTEFNDSLVEVFPLVSLLLLFDDGYDCWPSPTSLKYVLNILHAIF